LEDARRSPPSKCEGRELKLELYSRPVQNQHDMIRVKHDIYGLAINVADSEKKLCSFVPQFPSLHRNLGGVKGGKRLRCAMKSRVTPQSPEQQNM
jgi:hypothetical protein